MSGVRQNFDPECEKAVNKLIGWHLDAWYAYTWMAFHFDRDDIALPNFHKYCLHIAGERRTIAETLMAYQNKRGGRIVLENVKRPCNPDLGSPIEIFRQSLNMEKEMNVHLSEVATLASKHCDADLDELIDDLVQEKVEIIKKIANHLGNLERVGKGLGEYMFDKESLS